MPTFYLRAFSQKLGMSHICWTLIRVRHLWSGMFFPAAVQALRSSTSRIFRIGNLFIALPPDPKERVA